MLYLASDHGGFGLKEELKKFLEAQKVVFEDLGPQVFDPNDDYPRFAKKVAEKVAQGAGHAGILMCRSGQGMCIAANKFKGVRAGVCWDAQVASAAKRDDDINILCLPSDYVLPQDAINIFKAWNEAKFSPEPRFSRRLDEISELEK